MSKTSDRKTRKPGYLQQAIQLALAKRQPGGGVYHVVVEHEYHCPAGNGGKHCACKPTVTMCEGNA